MTITDDATNSGKRIKLDSSHPDLTGKVMVVLNPLRGEGANIVAEAPTGSDFQLWEFEQQPHHVTEREFYRLTFLRTGLVLDVAHRKTDRGALCVQWSWNGGDNQLFELRGEGEGGSFYLVAKHSNLPLGMSAGPQPTLFQWAWEDTEKTKFNVS